jgi:glycosyltransferase involved in cell wall biosynthesis
MVLHARVVAGSGGGPDKTILRSARYANPERLRMAAAYIYPHGDRGIELLRTKARNWGCPLWEFPETGPIDPGVVQSLLRLCREQRTAIWHAHDYKTDALGVLLRRFWPMKLVTTVHGWTRESLRTRLYYHVDNWCLNRYDHVIVVNRDLSEHCRERGVREDRMTYIPNAIEHEGYRRQLTVEGARGAMGVATDRLVVGVVGRLSVEKGVDRSIHCVAELRKRFPNVELHLIGDGPERGRLEALVTESGLKCAVRFWGWQAEVKPFYEVMDVLLLPSRTEGLPNVVLEAMAMEVPVAATDVGGVSDLLDGGGCGVILGLDEAGWSGRIGSILSSRELRAELASRARRRVETDYSFHKRMERVMGIYDRVLGVGAAHGSGERTGGLPQAA